MWKVPKGPYNHQALNMLSSIEIGMLVSMLATPTQIGAKSMI